jgi:hypothetical protein
LKESHVASTGYAESDPFFLAEMISEEKRHDIVGHEGW